MINIQQPTILIEMELKIKFIVLSLANMYKLITLSKQGYWTGKKNC